MHHINRRPAIRRKTGALLAALLAALLLASCSAKQPLPISSLDYDLPEKLPEGRFDEKYAEKMNSPGYAYADRNIYISVKNDVLLLSATDPTGGRSRSLAVGGGCFTATDGGPDGPAGSVSFRTGEGKVVPLINESCRALMSPDQLSCLVVTCVYGDAEGKGAQSRLYRLTRADSGDWRRSLVTTLDGIVTAACLAADGQSVYVALNADTNALLSIAPDGRLTRLSESELLQQLEISSVLLLGGKLYCSSKLGILTYDPASETERWFPVNWAKLG